MKDMPEAPMPPPIAGAGWVWFWIVLGMLVLLVLIGMSIAIYRLRKSVAFTVAKKRGIYADAQAIGWGLLISALLGGLVIFCVVYSATTLWPAPTRLAATAVA